VPDKAGVATRQSITELLTSYGSVFPFWFTLLLLASSLFSGGCHCSRNICRWYNNWCDSLNFFMKNILIFAVVAGVAIVAAYYLLIEDILIEGRVEPDDIPVF
jgi:hypothetical protein